MLNIDTNVFRAIGTLAARQARAAAPSAQANEVIDMTPLLKAWQPGPHDAGSVVVYEGLPYKVVQTNDSTGNPGWNPTDAPSLFALRHGTDAAHALPFKAEGHNPYMAGEYASFSGKIYMCRLDGTVHDPGVLPGSWEVVTE